jgi:hypothetical protein
MTPRPAGTTKEIPVDDSPGWVWRLEIERQFGSDPRLVFTLEKSFRTAEATTIASFRDSDGKLADEIMDVGGGEPDELANEIVNRLLQHAFEGPPANVAEAMSDHIFAWICEQRVHGE